jgi:dihydrodipicolinate synthase/N-acetylneuraminate lyase
MVTLYYFGAILFVGSSRSALAFAAAGMILGAPTALPPSPILSVATPFSSSSGSVVDWSAFDAYLESLHHAGIQAVLCNGLEGEGNSLTSEERQRVAERCRLKFSGAVLCDVSDSCSRRAIQNVAWCSPYVDALLLRAPACDDAHGLEAFLSEVISTSPIPVLLHHTGVELGGEGALSPSTYASITNKHSLVVGVLESSGSITTMKGNCCGQTYSPFCSLLSAHCHFILSLLQL